MWFSRLESSRFLMSFTAVLSYAAPTQADEVTGGVAEPEDPSLYRSSSEVSAIYLG